VPFLKRVAICRCLADELDLFDRDFNLLALGRRLYKRTADFDARSRGNAWKDAFERIFS